MGHFMMDRYEIGIIIKDVIYLSAVSGGFICISMCYLTSDQAYKKQIIDSAEVGFSMRGLSRSGWLMEG